MSGRLTVSVCVHLELPPACEPAVAEARWASTLAPTLAVLCDPSAPPVGVVLGAELVAWLDANAPEAIRRLRLAVDAERVEVIGAPGHLPLFELVPPGDWVAQTQSHAALMLARFGARPVGAWLPWGAWDPALPPHLHAAGMRWVAVPVGAWGPEAAAAVRLGVAVTEREGRAVRLAVGDQVRDLGGWGAVARWLSHREAEAAEGASVHLLDYIGDADDPAAPIRFAAGLAALQSHGDRPRLALPSVAVNGLKRPPQVYLGAWNPWYGARPVSCALERPRERGVLHKAMLRASRQVELAAAVPGAEPIALVQARRYLHRAQAGASFVPEAAGGVDEPPARRRAWRDVIRAERVARGARGAAQRVRVEQVDADGDAEPEWRVRLPRALWVVDPGEGGALREWNLAPPAVALLGTPGHGGGFRLFALEPDAPLPSEPPAPGEAPRWETITAAEEVEGEVTLRLAGLVPGAPASLWWTRTWTFLPHGGLRLHFDVHQRGHDPVHLRACARLVLDLPAGELRHASDKRGLLVQTRDLAVRLRCDEPAELVAELARDAQGRVQGVAVTLVWPLALWDGGRAGVSLGVELS